MKLLNFAFIGSFTRYLQTSRYMSVVHFEVGGYKCSIDSQDLAKHPGSLLDQFSKSNAQGELISVDRDGEVFKYVNAFLVNGQLPRDRRGALTLDASMLEKIRKEADYFGLNALKVECGERTEKPLAAHLPVYLKMHNFITGIGHSELEEQVNVIHSKSPLIQALHSALQPDKTPSRFDVHIWYSQYNCGDHGQEHTTISEPAGCAVLSALESELTDTSPVILALQHVYPIAACTHECMRGSDRALYDLLVERYHVQVVSCTVYRAESYWDESAYRLEGAMLTPAIIQKNVDRTESIYTQEKSALQHRSKLFLHHKLQFEHVMHFVPATESGPQNGEAVYLISGLQIKRKC